MDVREMNDDAHRAPLYGSAPPGRSPQRARSGSGSASGDASAATSPSSATLTRAARNIDGDAGRR